MQSALNLMKSSPQNRSHGRNDQRDQLSGARRTLPPPDTATHLSPGHLVGICVRCWSEAGRVTTCARGGGWCLVEA